MDGFEILQQNKEVAEGRKHKSYREVVPLHSCESWSWNKEMVDTLHGWESRNLDVMSTRKWEKILELGMVSSESNQDGEKQVF